jgi:DNA topoisomerase I
MSKTLIVIESPGKRKKLQSILGGDYLIAASIGHIRDLPKKEIGVEAPDYKPHYVSDARQKNAISALKEAAAKADHVLLATDPDREGEAIAWHVAQVLKLKNPERVTYQEISEKAVKAAVAAPRPLDMNLVHAQEARRSLDRLVGYKVSPALSRKAGQQLTAGRVQSPAVMLVVNRERAIRAFTATQHYGALLTFDGSPDWRAAWQTKPHLVKGSEYLLSLELAQAVAAVQRVRVTAFADTQTKAAPPAPFTTSTLQQRAQAAMKFRPKKTMEVAQKLYEQGAITYMRTDSPNLSDDAFNAIADYAKTAGLPLAHERRRWKAKGGAQEAHEAIRPSHIEIRDAGETDDEKALYRLIWTRAVASQLADAVFAVRTAELVATAVNSESVDAATLAFVARGRTLIDKGWKAVYDEPDEDKDADAENDESSNPVPVLETGVEIDVKTGVVQTKLTKAPARYTLATLIKELENHGIGRPATYAQILDNISKREYIAEDKKGFLSATNKAETIVDSLLGTFQFIALDYTRDLENDLDLIADGSKGYREVISDADQQLNSEIDTLGPGIVHPCPQCQSPMYRRSGAHGFFWACSAYPDCKTTRPDIDGQPAERAERKEQAPASNHKCPDCQKPLRRNTKLAKDDPKKKGWDFWGCTGFPKCKKTFKPDPNDKSKPLI